MSKKNIYLVICLVALCSRLSAQFIDGESPNKMFTIAAYRGADMFNFHGGTEKPTPFTGIYLQSTIKRYLISVDFNFMDRIIDDQQLIKPFTNNTYRVSIGKTAALSLGFCENRWISQAAAPYVGEPTRITDDNGTSYFIKNPLIKYSAPSFIFGYHFIGASLVSEKNTELVLDDYDLKHKKKFRPMWMVSGTIDLMYAPVAKAETDILYCPYGYYVPRTLHVTTTIKERHFGVNLKMVVTTPYLFGLYMAIGLLPSAFSTEVDNKMNVNARAGILINFSRGKV